MVGFGCGAAVGVRVGRHPPASAAKAPLTSFAAELLESSDLRNGSHFVVGLLANRASPCSSASRGLDERLLHALFADIDHIAIDPAPRSGRRYERLREQARLSVRDAYEAGLACAVYPR